MGPAWSEAVGVEMEAGRGEVGVVVKGAGLPSHLQEVKACGEIFQTVDLFVTLATEEVLRLLSQVAPQAVRERRRSTGEEEEEERTGEDKGKRIE